MVCNSGVGLTPIIAGKVHHFSTGGLYNGLVLLIDDETETYWDHITGEAVYGPLTGAQTDMWSIRITNVKTALQEQPDLLLLRSKPGFLGGMISWAMSLPFFKGKLLPGFRKTMDARDDRLPEMEIGLGVIAYGIKRFYPMALIRNSIEDDLGDHAISVGINESDGMPYAQLAEGTRPIQLFTRWYGFAYTYPGCEIYAKS